eukprot:gnl/MRDRNA2_/MRDRNA2_28395_c0_seq1.p1 gnl/MRDRNA2_/MRDRNA2_28395_c0~~gnl/MRDRNA2_/MRDRNA2_28395_c0_seq1.p1  ORF type:complete len:564 (+),score=152.05 gnl/MRDRNA2_/MRDRNA2_28395_c0_seq1:81-1772(+)
MKLFRIFLFAAPGVSALQQSPGSAAGVVGELKQLKDVLSAKSGLNATAKAPVLESEFAAIRDHLKDANMTTAETKKQDVIAKAEAIIAKAAEQKNQSVAAEAPNAKAADAPKPVEKEAVKVDAKPVEAPKPQATQNPGFACECAPGAACPEVCTMGIKAPTTAAPSSNPQKQEPVASAPASNTSVSNTTVKLAVVHPAVPEPVHGAVSKPDVSDADIPPLATNWTAFASKVMGFSSVHGASFVHGDAEVRGVAASKEFKKGDTVLTVPAEMTLSKENHALRRFFGNINVKDPDSTWRLVSFLAVEKQLGSQSPWARFFEHLPTADDFKKNHPLWGEKALLEKFVPIPLLHEIHNYQKMFKEDYRIWKRFVKATNQNPSLFVNEKGLSNHVRLLRQAVPSVTKDELFWAFTVVLTRGFETAHGTALAPVADDFNTDLATHQNAQWHAKPGGSVEIVTTHDVKSGDEILINYASTPIDNAKFAAVWGFDLANNNVGVSRLGYEDCQALEDKLVWKAKKTALRTGRPTPTQKLGSCEAPAFEKQPGIYCTLLSIAKEHCPYVKDFA